MKKKSFEKSIPLGSSSYNSNVCNLCSFVGVCGGLVFFFFHFEGEIFSLCDQVVCLPVELTLFDISGGMTYSSEALEL